MITTSSLPIELLLSSGIFAQLSEAGRQRLSSHLVKSELTTGAVAHPPEGATPLGIVWSGGPLQVANQLEGVAFTRNVGVAGVFGALAVLLPDEGATPRGPVEATAQQACTVGWVQAEAFQGEDAAARELRTFVSGLTVAEVLRMSPDLRRFSDQQCARLGQSGAFRRVEVGERWHTHSVLPGKLGLVLPGAQVEISRTERDGTVAPHTPYPLTDLGIMGVEGLLPRRSTFKTEIVVTAAGWIAEIPSRVIQKLAGPLGRFASDAYWLPSQLRMNILALTNRWESLPTAVSLLAASEIGARALEGRPLSLLYAVAQASELLSWDPGAPPPVALQARPGVVTLLSGELMTVVRPPSSEAMGSHDDLQVLPASRHPAGVVVGTPSVRGPGSWFRHWAARTSARLLFSDGVALGVLRRGKAREADEWKSFVLPATLLAVQTSLTEPPPAPAAGLSPLRGGLLWSLAPGPAARREAALASLVAQAIAEGWGERVDILSCTLDGPSTPQPAEGPGAPLVRRLSMGLPADPQEAAAHLREALERIQAEDPAHSTLLVLDAARPHAGMRPALATVIGRSLMLDDHQSKSFPHDQPRHVPYLYTGFLDPKLGPEAFADHLWPAHTVRLRMDLESVPLELNASLSQLEAEAPDAARRIRRWARGITNRLVGVTLSGGGAWGFTHVAALEALNQLGVPVDLLSGTSFGSLVGSFYAWGGFEGGMEKARQLVDPDFANELMRSIYGNMINGAAIERLIRRHLGDVPLAWMELPFYPAATELTRGSQTPMTNQSLPFAVNATTSWAPMWPAAPAPDGVYVDGAWTNNLPAEITQLEGARLMVSSNVILPPWQPLSRPPYRRGRLYNAVQALGLRGRMLATVRAGLTLYNRQGRVSSGVSPNLFQTDSLGLEPMAFNKGLQVALDARSAQTFNDSALATWQSWKALCQPGA